jgi:hypothetical protein
MKNRSDVSCEYVQQLLLRKNPGELDVHVTEHLESCQKCREFQGLLTQFSNSTEAAAEESLQPDPQILKTLKNRLEETSATSNRRQKSNLFEPLLALFQRRIPVYQFLLAVFIAAIFYFSFIKTNWFEPKPQEPNVISQSEQQTIQPVEFPIQSQLDQTNQVGKSLAEDSISAKFRVSIL